VLMVKMNTSWEHRRGRRAVLQFPSIKHRFQSKNCMTEMYGVALYLDYGCIDAIILPI
jgi:hypothetical protein